MVIWERSGEAYHASVRANSGEVLFHLVVERLNHAWDWSVWRPEDSSTTARHGVASTAQEAMRVAERAAQ
jgi:hypothetical protein